MTGGNTLHQHFSERLERDIRCIRPFQSSFHISSARDPLLDAWRGGGTWAAHTSNQDAFVTREEYLERGSEFMKQHKASNMPLTFSPSAVWPYHLSPLHCIELKEFFEWFAVSGIKMSLVNPCMCCYNAIVVLLIIIIMIYIADVSFGWLEL